MQQDALPNASGNQNVIEEVENHNNIFLIPLNT